LLFFFVNLLLFCRKTENVFWGFEKLFLLFTFSEKKSNSFAIFYQNNWPKIYMKF
jgi:hypothetical protein